MPKLQICTVHFRHFNNVTCGVCVSVSVFLYLGLYFFNHLKIVSKCLSNKKKNDRKKNLRTNKPHHTSYPTTTQKKE